jgi:hypothetical protein
MSAMETYKIAHTARCKLQLAADRPDRDLRFILGHAFTLDKLRLRIAEIELESSSDSDEDGGEEESKDPVTPLPRRVTFRNSANRPVDAGSRNRSPPPENPGVVSDDSSSDDDDEGEVDDEDADLGLERFGSGAAQPPRMIDDDSSDEEEELKMAPNIASEEELRLLTQGQGDVGLAEMYQRVANCPCHGHKAPVAENMWEIPQKLGQNGPRIAVVEVHA